MVVNTVNLKADWDFFKEKDTYLWPFHMAGGDADVPMMHGPTNAGPEEKTGIDGDEFAAVRLKTDGPVDVWVVVPKGEGTLESLRTKSLSSTGFGIDIDRVDLVGESR